MYTERSSIDTGRVSEEIRQFSEYIHTNAQALESGNFATTRFSEKQDSIEHHKPNGVHKTMEPPPITVTPATPDQNSHFPNSEKRSNSIDQDSSKGKKVQQMLKNRVHKSHARISTISRKIGHGMARNGGSSSASLRRTTSAPGQCFSFSTGANNLTWLQISILSFNTVHTKHRRSILAEDSVSSGIMNRPQRRHLHPRLPYLRDAKKQSGTGEQ
jgi:hypothetical protein